MSLVGAPDADILAEAIKILQKRIAAGTAIFLVKVKAHREEPTNKGADILEDKAISDLKLGKEWCQAVFTSKKPCREAGKVTYQDRHSIFNNCVGDAIRRLGGAAENEVQKHEERLTGAWRQMSTLRRRYEKWCEGDDIEDCTHKQRYKASYQSMVTVKVLQQNTWIDDRKFLKSCVQARAKQGNINHLAYGMWTADFMLRQNKSKAFLGEHLDDPCVPWRHKKARNDGNCRDHSGSQMAYKNQTAIRCKPQCRLCKRAPEQRGASTEFLPEETYGHINSAFCD